MAIKDGFFDSYKKLEGFLRKWIDYLNKRCDGHPDNQIKASYYIWARYAIAIRSFRHLCELQFFPDLCIIARCCVEYEASLSAVLNDQDAATNYLEFEKHAKANYLRKFGNTIDKNKKEIYENELASLGVKRLEDYKWAKWCVKQGGYSGLIEKYVGKDAKRLYSLLSELAHGSVMAVKFLQNTANPNNIFLNVVELVYSGYLIGTKSFLDKALGPIITSDSETCKNEFDEVICSFGSRL